ncbi:MAG: peptidase S15, partial [Alphaproteobacteria bacterium]|nr:peptidase S15 [Alphaproteobacteria bacterium]
WSVHPTDPARAEATCDWTQTLRRGAWKVCTRASTRIWVEGDALVMQARLEAWEGEVQVFARDTTERVVRDHV